MAISLCDETKLSITTNGLSAKKTKPKTSVFGDIFRRILLTKKAVPIKLKDVSALKRKNVGRKNCMPTKDKGTVNPSQVGPYG
jgi:arginine/lysine/ornithine decarboxylase